MVSTLYISTTTSCFDGTKRCKTTQKYTILDSQESFAIIGKTPEELDAKFNLLKLQSSNIQPLLLIVGDFDNIRAISVYFDGIKYPMVNLLTAIDILYKIMFTFNLEFPKQSHIFYLFIQKFFYEMSTEKKNVKVSTFISQILN